MLFSGKIPFHVAARLTPRFWVPHLLQFATIRDCSPLFTLFETIRTIRYSGLFAVRYSRLFAIRVFQTPASGAVCDAEMSKSSAVDNPVPTVSDSAEMPESSGVDVPANINNSTSVNIDLADNASTSTLDEIGLEVNAVKGDSYAARTAGL